MSTTASIPIVTENEPRLRLWTRGEFDRMLHVGVFQIEEDVELCQGQVHRRGEDSPRHWTRGEYHHLIDSGILGEEERVELLDGEIFEKMTNNPPHTTAVGKTADVLRQAFRTGFFVREQVPLGVSVHSEPEPDVMVVPGVRDDYADHHPLPSDAVLVVEVSDSSLRTDQGRKMRLYAMAGCREYWIVNLPKRLLEVYRDPAGDGYGTKRIYTDADSVSPLAALNAAIRVADLLPLVRSNP